MTLKEVSGEAKAPINDFISPIGYGNEIDYERLIASTGLPLEVAQLLEVKSSSDKMNQNPYGWVFEDRPVINAGVFLAAFKAKTHFAESSKSIGIRVKEDVIGLVRFVQGKKETYMEKLRAEEKKGHTEAASFGLSRIGNQEVVLYAMHWDFFAGTLGAVAGKLFEGASDLAIKRKLPLVCIFSSGGIRNQENVPGLFQMPRIVRAIDRFKEKTDKPCVSVLAHQVWGGISASGVPLGDVRIGLKGTDFGFSGPRVIESYDGTKVPKGAQSVEAHFSSRNVDLLLNEKDLLHWLENYLEAARVTDKNKVSEGDIRKISSNEKIVFSEENLDSEHLFEQYRAVMKNIGRPDTKKLLNSCFTDVVPLYSCVSRGSIESYPAIIAGLGKIEDQTYLIIGNQPSYQKKESGEIIKIPSSPAPADLRYLRRMLEFGERLKLPLVFFTDTPGAKPTLESETNDQAGEIAKAIQAGLRYKYPVISIITGLLGSGGGLATTPIGDSVAMFSQALACVAEPGSATAILNNKAYPTPEEIALTIQCMKATAPELMRLKLIDEIIWEPKDGVQTNPQPVIDAVKEHILRETYRLQHVAPAKLLKKRDRRLRELDKFPLTNGKKK